jgi:C-terminal processing protease CtpA/Prc
VSRKSIVRILALAAGTGLFLACLPLTPGSSGGGQSTTAQIRNDQGGPTVIEGQVTYTNVYFTFGTAQPLVILEDEAGFVIRDHSFVMPPESQTLGQITSDFYRSPFTYTIELPITPQGTLSDVDNDGQQDTGVQIFAVAYWTNTWGDPYLERRDLGGGGWSTAYASTRISTDAATRDEIIGGTLLIYAPDDQQGFPSGFGTDGLLFTADDPIVGLPQGYTVVNLDSDPFTFDRSREQHIDLIEGEFSALNDFSGMSYTEGFDAMIDLFRREYAFTDYKHIDWDAMSAEFRPRFEEAERNRDSNAYQRALRDFLWEIPDGHVGASVIYSLDQETAAGGLGMAIRELDDGRIIVNYLVDGGPADDAGIDLRAEILAINGEPIDQVVSDNVPLDSPFSTEHVRRLEQLRYAIRFPVGTNVEVTYRNPGTRASRTVTLTAEAIEEDFDFADLAPALTGVELPVEYSILESGYGYVAIYSFFDNELLTAQLWERAMQTFNDFGVPGVIVDMRENGGGNGYLADQMAAFFFNEELSLGNIGYYAADINDFYFDPEGEDYFYPPAENLRYQGPVTVLVGPACASACEFFSFDMTIQDRATVVGQYPTAGLGGSVEIFVMPEYEYVQFTIGRAVGPDGEIHIEGVGVVPDVWVPVTEDTLFSTGDPVLEAAVDYLDTVTR